MKIKFYLFLTFLLTISAFIPNSFAHDSPKLPKGVKERIPIGDTLSKGVITDMKYSPDGTQLAVATTKGLWIYDTSTHEKRWEHLIGNDDTLVGIVTIAFSPNSKLFASGEKDKILLWNAKTGKRIQTIVAKYFTTTLAFSPNSKILVSNDVMGIRLWDVETGSERFISAPLEGHRWIPSILAFSTDLSTLISASEDGTFRLWDVKTGNPLRVFEVPFSNIPGGIYLERNEDITERKYKVRAWAFNQDSKMLASGYLEIRLWDTQTGRKLAFFNPDDILFALAFSSDSKILASGSRNVRLWDVETRRELSNRSTGENVFALAFSPKGKTLATAVMSGGNVSILLWDVATIISLGSR